MQLVDKNGIFVPDKKIVVTSTGDVNNAIDIERSKEKFIFYTDFIIHMIKDKYLKLTDDIAIKQQHSLTMGSLVQDLTLKSGFVNESYSLTAFLDGLLHDVGRFKQYLLSGTLRDDLSKEHTGFNNHGEYGGYLLERNNFELLRYIIGDVKKYYQIITEVVRNHTKVANIKYDKKMEDLINIFPNYDINEVINSSDEGLICNLIALKILMVCEADSLELIYNVRDGKWKPLISSEKADFAHPEVLEKEFNWDNINIGELRSAGAYSCNDGFLFRYNLIFRNIKYTASLRSIIDDNTIDKVFEMQYNNVKNDNGEVITDDSLKDPTMLFARDYTNFCARTLLKCCGDSKIITEEAKKVALEICQKEFGPRYQELVAERKKLVR